MPHARATRRRTAACAATVVAAVMIAACGGDDDDTGGATGSAATAATAAGATGPASPPTSPAATDVGTSIPGSTDDAAFPVTIDHALGSTEIPARPERVITLGYGEGDIVAALGIVPLAINAYGARADLPTPWFDEAVDGTDVQLLNLADGIPYERIAALDPDVILAAS